jgi:polyisoprenoid-binding protein YceI
MNRVAWLLAIVAPAALAWTSVNITLRAQPTSKLWVTGTSTVKSFECQAKSFDALVDATLPDAVTAVLAGEKGVNTVALKVPTEKMDCGNGTMNEHMMKAIKGKDNPTIAFELSSYDLAKIADGVGVKIAGTLALGGVKKDITVDATAKAGPDGALLVTGVYPLKMSEWGLKPPTLMLGTLKVNENVKVNFELLLKP